MVRLIKQLAAASAVVLCAAPAALAHPGHGVIPAEEPAHWLEPVHAIPIALLIAAVFAVVWRVRTRDRT